MQPNVSAYSKYPSITLGKLKIKMKNYDLIKQIWNKRTTTKNLNDF